MQRLLAHQVLGFGQVAEHVQVFEPVDLAACFGEMEQIKHDAADRLAASGDRVIWAMLGMLGFESPPPADLAPPADDGGHP
ncbi:MAG TPA: hypothetical protein VFJ57_06340 [Solirubrobacterales bacterium]|nr:hypothetical protein [Solirubrobacterales bacterium]